MRAPTTTCPASGRCPQAAVSPRGQAEPHTGQAPAREAAHAAKFEEIDFTLPGQNMGRFDGGRTKHSTTWSMWGSTSTSPAAMTSSTSPERVSTTKTSRAGAFVSATAAIRALSELRSACAGTRTPDASTPLAAQTANDGAYFHVVFYRTGVEVVADAALL
jgi:hypothetical protein